MPSPPCYDSLIAESRAGILQGLFDIMALEARGEDTAPAERALAVLEGNLVLYRHLKGTTAEARRLMARSALSAQ